MDRECSSSAHPGFSRHVIGQDGSCGSCPRPWRGANRAYHLGQGLVLGTGALLVFGVFKVAHAIRAGDLGPLQALGSRALLLGLWGR